MKSKKKMLLALGAMSAAAIGAGATSTFAWYTSMAAASAAVGSKTDAIEVDKVTAAGLSVRVNFEFYTVEQPELSDSTGKCYYIIDGQPSPVLSSAGKSWGKYAIKVTTPDTSTWINALKSEGNHTSVATFTLTAATPANDVNLVLLEYAETPANDHSKNTVANHSIEVTFSAAMDYSNGTIAVTKIAGQAVTEIPTSTKKFTNDYALFGVRPKSTTSSEAYTSYSDSAADAGQGKYLTVTADNTVNS